MKILIVMPKFASHENDLSISNKFDVDLIAYDEKVLVKKRWYFILFLPFISVLSALGICNYYRCCFYLRDYTKLNKFLTSQLKKLADTQYVKVLWIKAAGVGSDVIKLDGVGRNSRYLYFYDPIQRYPDSTAKMGLFRRSFSFDPADCRAFNITYLPMVMGKGLDGIHSNDNSPLGEQIYDLVYVGSFNFRRLISLIFMKYASKEFVSYFALVNKNLPNIRLCGLDFKNQGICRNKLFSLYQQSRVILELRDIDQAGFSQRKNDSKALNKSFYSLPCFQLRVLSEYRCIGSNIKNILQVKKCITRCIDSREHTKEIRSTDEFLDEIFL